MNLTLDDQAIDAIAAKVADLLAARDPGTAGSPTYLDVAGAADLLCCPTSRIYALVSAKRIPHHRDGSRLLFQTDELHAYVKAGGAKRP